MIQVKRLTNADSDRACKIAELFYSSYNAYILSDEHNYLLAAYRDEELAGFLLAYELERLDSDHPMMFLYTIDVLPGHRRKGIGRSLINELKLRTPS